MAAQRGQQSSFCINESYFFRVRPRALPTSDVADVAGKSVLVCAWWAASNIPNTAIVGGTVTNYESGVTPSGLSGEMAPG